MTLRLLRSVVAIALLIVLLNATIFGCGPFSLDAIFVFTVHPAYPLERFARGEIGVIQPTYARSYLYVAYRHLESTGFSNEEQRVLTELWKERLDFQWNLGADDWVKSWLAARQKVPGLAEPPKIDVYRNREKPNQYETYLNCQKDSFDTAISILNERIAKYSADNPAVKAWIEGQDQVFANCSEGQHLPSPPVATDDALSRADRVYQIAAANFYASNFDEARKGFEAIASDKESPWHRTAPYLVARTLVRKASLGAPESKVESLSQAEGQLSKILADTRQPSLHPAASRLLDLVRLRLHPSERLRELSQRLMVKTQNEDLKQNLWDYTILLDGLLDTDEGESKPKLAGGNGADDLTDWISTVQSGTKEALEHSLARWQATHSAAWLVASLSKVDGQHPRSAELISQAKNVQPNSAAFATARFHAVRLTLESGNVEAARAQLEQLLTTHRTRFDESSLNLLIGQRMLLANSLAEFLTYAPRVPAALSWNDDGREIPSEASEVAEERKELLGKPLFDEEAAKIINKQIPLSVLKEAARSNGLPTHLRRDVAQAAWLRAIILGDDKTADELVPTLKALVPELSNLLDDVLSKTQPDAKKFSGIYAWLKSPGLEPVVDMGLNRQTPLNEQDSYRDNWWCSAVSVLEAESSGEEKGATQPVAPRRVSRPLFLSEAQQTQAAKESSALNELGAAPNYLCRQVVQWATKNPTDQRAPEALHLAVTATRYGCTDKETGRWSKAAFDLLHRKYPNTTWARKTPYWFKD